MLPTGVSSGAAKHAHTISDSDSDSDAKSLPKKKKMELGISNLPKDILSHEHGQLLASLQMNFMVDLDWLMRCYVKAENSEHPITVLYGNLTCEDLSAYPNVEKKAVQVSEPWGTHHTKLMLLLYDAGLRVVVHTANMIAMDWINRSQGAWVSPLFSPLNGEASATAGDSRTKFKKDLLEYLAVYRTEQNVLKQWIEIIKKHQFQEANVFLLASCPGRHRGRDRDQYGHMRLRSILQSHNGLSSNTGGSLVAQFSSIGSLGASPSQWLEGEFVTSLNMTQQQKQQTKPKLQLIYPTVEDVRLSLDGYISGGSLPYTNKVHMRQPWLTDYLHSRYRMDDKEWIVTTDAEQEVVVVDVYEVDFGVHRGYSSEEECESECAPDEICQYFLGNNNGSFYECTPYYDSHLYTSVARVAIACATTLTLLLLIAVLYHLFTQHRRIRAAMLRSRGSGVSSESLTTDYVREQLRDRPPRYAEIFTIGSASEVAGGSASETSEGSEKECPPSYTEYLQAVRSEERLQSSVLSLGMSNPSFIFGEEGNSTANPNEDPRSHLLQSEMRDQTTAADLWAYQDGAYDRPSRSPVSSKLPAPVPIHYNNGSSSTSNNPFEELPLAVVLPRPSALTDESSNELEMA
ncbi:unnamed protein product [Cyprideis torosa]|uniref:Uncharacterized protein n=1 Tax=Cyprideis torosa TaxID=163714 RepID=A0A7R8W9X2_9CRUS|nr:unnamed protein product [Cyprideis torosa]CAG0884760.1 unnamed protein product [Cyprideis torosa]